MKHNLGKDFQKWHGQKSNIQEHVPRLFFHEREVWFLSLGANIGFEQDGKGEKFLRPVVIVKKFNNETFWGIPTTKKPKIGKYYFQCTYSGAESTTAILSQLRMIDAKRLVYKIGTMNATEFSEMKKRIISFLE